MTFKLSTKDGFGQTESMANVQVSIAVGEWKRHNELFLIGIGSVGLKDFGGFPFSLDFYFIGSESIAFGSSFGCHVSF